MTYNLIYLNLNIENNCDPLLINYYNQMYCLQELTKHGQNHRIYTMVLCMNKSWIYTLAKDIRKGGRLIDLRDFWFS